MKTCAECPEQFTCTQLCAEIEYSLPSDKPMRSSFTDRDGVRHQPRVLVDTEAVEKLGGDTEPDMVDYFNLPYGARIAGGFAMLGEWEID